MKVNLFDDHQHQQLFPLTFTRPSAELRIGILTIKQKWEHDLKANCLFSSRQYLNEKYPSWGKEAVLWINGRVLPDEALIDIIEKLQPGTGVRTGDNQLIALAGSRESWENLTDTENWLEQSAEFVSFPEDIFIKNEVEIERDFARLTKGRTSTTLSASNSITGPGEIFLEEGAKVEGSFLNPNGGYIYIGAGAEVMDGSMIRGSMALCEYGVLKLGTKVYGATTIGPYCKVGGEVNNSVLIGYSNKGHDGFLGNSVIGEWCNLGAGSNNSNLKNNYAEVRLWDYANSRFRNTGLQFCGLFMGDHAKCGISTMFNTGTVIGVCSNIFGSGFPRNFVPSFAWGGNSGFTTFQLNKVFETAKVVFERRSMTFDETEKKILTHLFDSESKSRFWENTKTINI